ncbi:uncharacterized protein [Panulirus ornatus]|uniref:uncharacterized protein n=1 Tax=Panulirus ornatus TaxID=150431 RepID=UPI003A84477E
MMSSWLLFLAIFGVVAGLKVGPVHLANNQSYISYVSSDVHSRLICPYELSEGEDLNKVSWYLWDGDERVGTYEWFPSLDSTAEGLLEGAVNMSRDDGQLELTQLRYDLGGFYSCAVSLTDGQRKEGEKWEVLIIDITSASSYSSGKENLTTCTYYESFRSYPVYPPPTVHSGMYSKQLDWFYDEVTPREWQKSVYHNKSTAYSYTDRAFKIDANTPDDAVLLTTIGVTKTDGSYIALTELWFTSHMWTPKGCKMPSLLEHQVLKVHDGYKTCRDQLAPYIANSSFEAEVRCEKGYHSEGSVDFVKMICNKTFSWITQDGEEPSLQHLQCVIDDTDGGGGGDGGGGSSDNVKSSVHLVLGTLFLLCLLRQ